MYMHTYNVVKLQLHVYLKKSMQGHANLKNLLHPLIIAITSEFCFHIL